ncbi:MAG: tetratricopeptide repeat protein [Planctomycetota bacterium]
MNRALALATCLAPLLGVAAHAAPEDSEKDEAARRAEAALGRYRAYLARKPFHDWAFDKLVEAAVAKNVLEQLVADYRKAADADAHDLSARVVLARLLAATERREQALELLAKLEPQEGDRPAWLALRGALHLRLRQPREALALLEQAAALLEKVKSRDPRLATAIQRRRGEAALAAGEKARAVAAFRALAALSPESLNARLESARLLADNGLLDEALEELEQAKTLAGQRADQRCRVLAEIGRLRERRAEVPQALAVYREAIALTGRGNWLGKDLRGRVLALHRRSGKLAELVTQSEADLAQDPGDLGRREFLAEVYEACERAPDARALLERAVKDFPQDLALSRALLALLGRLGDLEGRIREYQRILGHHPEELELHVELGQAFAAAGKGEAARRQWQASLRERLQDPALCLRLAELHARAGQSEDAVELYQRAIELRPEDTAPVGDLARLLQRLGRDVLPLLERAARSAQGDLSAQAEVAALFEAHQQPARALALVEAALPKAAGGPVELRLLRDRARLLLAVGRVPEALACLERAIERAPDPGVRANTVEELLRVARQHQALPGLLERAEQGVASGQDALAPYLVLARAAARARDPGRAQRALEALLVRRPGQPDAHQELARLCERQGDYERALVHLQGLLADRGAPRRQVLEDMARVHLRRYDRDAALRCYRDILAASPGNPAAFKEVAKAYERLGMFEDARGCWRQAVRLEPRDGKARLELARVLERLGERAAASEEILAATQTEDRRTREHAREAYYRALAARGAVEEEVARLRQRCLDNPYDLEAPLTLIDLYVRELEYEPALEVLDVLLGYQPQQPDLLEQRARLCVLLERYPEAIAALETLWRLPNADRERLALAIGDAALRQGDLDRAERTLASVRDPSKVAALYEEQDLPERAQAALVAGLERAPQDARLHRRLARLSEDSGERAVAAGSLEQVISLRGERFDDLLELGELYHRLERPDDVAAVGQRLFALLRREEPAARDEDEDAKKKDEDEDSPWRQNQRTGWRQRYQERLGALQKYFEAGGLRERFLELGAGEWRLHPGNDQLLAKLVQSARGPQAAAALALLDEAGRAPQRPLHLTARAWAQELQRLRREVLRAEAKLRRERSAALGARLGELSLLEGIELLTVYELDQDHAQGDKALAALLARFPQSARLQVAEAERLERAERHTDALAALGRALALLEARAAEEDAERASRLALRFKTRRPDLVQGFPLRVQARVDPDTLRRLFRLSEDGGAPAGWTLGEQPSAAGVRLSLARCAEKAKQPEAARAALAGLTPAHPDDLPAWSRLATACFERELPAEGARVCARLRALEAELERDPLLGLNRAWARLIDQPMTRWARALEREGQWVEAYDLLRSYGQAGAGRLLLEQHDALGAAEGHYRALLGEARQALAAKAPGAAARVRDAGVKLAEVLQVQKRWDEARDAFAALIADLPDAWDLYGALARLHLRADREEEAVAVYRQAIARKRELRQRPPEQPRPAGRVLAPQKPDGLAEGEDHWAWSNLTWATQARGDELSVGPEYAAILRLYLTRRRIAQAATTLRQIAREDSRTFRWLGWTLTALVRDYKLGPAGLPVVRLLYGANQQDEWLGLDVGKSLVAGGELREARTVLRRVRARSRSQWSRDEAQRLLERIDRKLGQARRPTLTELRAAVDARPKQARPRVELTQRLFEARDFAGALREAAALREVAPHLPEARDLWERCLTVRGDRDGLAAHLREEVRRAKQPDQRFTLWLRAANLQAEAPPADPGPPARAALVEAEKAAGSPPRFSAANWWTERGRPAEARVLLEALWQKTAPGSWERERVEERLLEAAIEAGDGATTWRLVGRRLDEAGQRGKRLDVYEGLLASLADRPPRGAARAALLAAADALPGARGPLCRALVLLAGRELPAAEEALRQALARDADAARFCLPLYVELARGRGDWAETLVRLDAIEQAGLAGTEGTTSPYGSLQERELLRACRGEALLQLGRRDDALAEWARLVDPTREQTRVVHARLLAGHELWEPARQTLRAWLDHEGERDPESLRWLAAWSERARDLPAAAAALQRARTLARGRENDWQNLLAQVEGDLQGLARRTGALERRRATLAAVVSADPDDVGAAEALGQTLAELGRADELEALVERLSRSPSKAPGVWELLANLQQRAGKLEQAAASLAKAQGGDEWQDRERARRRARLLAAAGKLEEAEAALLSGFEDPDGADAQRALEGFLTQQRAWGPALAAARRQAELEPPGRTDHVQAEVELLLKLERPVEALGALWRRLCSPDGLLDQDGARERLLGLEQRVSAPVFAAAGGDTRLSPEGAPVRVNGVACLESRSAADLRFRQALLCRLRDDASGAERLSRQALAAEPEHHPTRWNLMQALAAQGRWRDALAEAARLNEALEREVAARSVVTDPLGTLRDLRARWLLRLGDREGALACWREAEGGRYRPIQPWLYSIYNAPQTSSSWRQLEGHGLFEAALAELERGRDWERGQARPRLLLRLGRDDEALAAAERLVFDPLGELLEEGRARGEHDALLHTAFELGRLEPLLVELRRRAAAAPRDEDLRQAVQAGLRLLGREAEALTWWQETAPWDAATRSGELHRLATAFERAGRPREAAARVRRELALDAATAIAFRSGSPYTMVPMGGAQALRFRWSGSSSRGGYYYSSGGRGPSDLEGERRTELRLLGLLAGCAAVDTRALSEVPEERERATLEARWLASALDPVAAKLSLAQRYAAAARPDLTEPLARQVLTADPERAREALAALVLARARAGDADADGLARGRAEWLAASDAAGQRDPHDPRLPLERARFLLREQGDVAALSSEVAALRRARPDDVEVATLAAWTARRQGDPAAARAACEAAQRLAFEQGAGEPADLQAVRALALHDLGDAAAPRLLRRALLACGRAHWAAPDLCAALGLPAPPRVSSDERD